MGSRSGYLLYDVAGADWTAARHIIRGALGDSNAATGMQAMQLAAQHAGLDAVESLSDWLRWVAPDSLWRVFDPYEVSYYGHLPWLAPGVELVRVRWGSYLAGGTEAAAQRIFVDLSLAGLVRLLIREET